MKKKMLSILLTLCMALALLPGTALAANGGFSIQNGVLTRYNGSGGNVVIPDGVTSIGKGAFEGCTSLKAVAIPDSVASIGYAAFYKCENLAGVDIPDSVTSIGDYAFGKCTSLTSISIPASVASVGDYAFRNCDSLKSAVFRGSATSIGKNIFYQCTALEELVNYPEEDFYTRLKANQSFLDGWFNPGQFVDAQSARITALSNEITAGLASDYEKAKAIATWVSENIEYDYSADSTVITSPEGVLDKGRTICAGYGSLTRALLQAAGIPAQYVIGKVDIISLWGAHGWNLAFVDGRWIWLDTTWGMEYFDAGTAFFSLDHWIWMSGTAAQDIPSDWARTEAWEAICEGLVPNDLQAAYRDDMTREEFCRLMVALLEEATGQDIGSYLASKGLTAAASFTDTSNADVAAAYALGIVNGASKTVFNPDGSITRQEAAAMLARTAKVLGLAAGKGESFADAGQFASWAKEDIAFISGLADPATGAKVMGGTGNGRFSPSSPYTREQAILTALRLFHCAA